MEQCSLYQHLFHLEDGSSRILCSVGNHPLNRLHNIVIQKTVLKILTIVKTLDLTTFLHFFKCEESPPEFTYMYFLAISNKLYGLSLRSTPLPKIIVTFGCNNLLHKP